MASRTQVSVQDCEDYIEQHGVQAILKECIAKICQSRPERPYRWLREYFEKLEKVGSYLIAASCVIAMHQTSIHPLDNHI